MRTLHIETLDVDARTGAPPRATPLDFGAPCAGPFRTVTTTDLESSLRLAIKYCEVVNPSRITADQREQLLVARAWLELHRGIVKGWLAGTLTGIDASVETPPEPLVDFVATPELLADFGRLLGDLLPATVQLSRRSDMQNLTTRSGKVMAVDIARHVVRIACVPTIEPGPAVAVTDSGPLAGSPCDHRRVSARLACGSASSPS